MLVLLPPSETKAPGGDPDALLDLDTLSFPELTRLRQRLAATLQRTSATKRAAQTLGLGPSQQQELQHNLRLFDAPTLPAVERYTGVLYDALDVASLGAEERTRLEERIAIASALFGLVRAGDRIPAYRLSGGTKLPRLGTLAGVWRPVLGPVLAEQARAGLVVDLRSGAYAALAPLPAAVTVRVLTEREDGSRSVVSHFNKATKGQVARLLSCAAAPCSTVADVVEVLEQGGLRVERRDELGLDVITT